MLNQENSIVQAVRPKPVVLIILDGWGVAPASLANAITQAKKPNFDFYCENYFCATLQASGQAVGLPYGEMGNSEVGHLNIGAGRIVYQDLPLINKAITDKEFFTNPIFVKALEKIKKNNSSLHLIGLFSEGGVHSSMDHLFALLELAKEQKIARVFIHAILDG
ncbi:MAG: phosphoglycerate mutase (2,3-diphosphoglycerate-independent), partial [Candidatus Brennerbacteria bacterium CG11_big_fil_rev_8_21_14_0_20_43_10]